MHIFIYATLCFSTTPKSINKQSNQISENSTPPCPHTFEFQLYFSIFEKNWTHFFVRKYYEPNTNHLKIATKNEIKIKQTRTHTHKH